ncbi:fimbrial protein [Burkholderia dolosa]|uniref:fimbrial protein n=1 Tax=Burkholderia dolosa TaxID=152500 RepID=UPI001B9228C8|nr:fimbrial protein [Burkholderia dolosa]MBR8316017.1 fimbrial protein [Burkholderia dolosa]
MHKKLPARLISWVIPIVRVSLFCLFSGAAQAAHWSVMGGGGGHLIIAGELVQREHDLLKFSGGQAGQGLKYVIKLNNALSAGPRRICVDIPGCTVTAELAVYDFRGNIGYLDPGSPVIVSEGAEIKAKMWVHNGYAPPGRTQFSWPEFSAATALAPESPSVTSPPIGGEFLRVARTCRVPPTTVDLGPVAIRDIHKAPPVPFEIALDCPHIGGGFTYRVHMVMTDAADPGNRTNILSSQSSGERGVGIAVDRVTDGGERLPVLFGPDSSDVGTRNQWIAGDNRSGTIRQRFTARYTPLSSRITPGAIHATATVTLGYD